MIVIGEQLQKTREAKNLDLDQVSADTNIARRYLTALEQDNFSIFPGDPYIIGFLRNYAEYLGLSATELVNAFKNMRVQEQPVPIAELIPSRSHKGLPIVLVIVVIAALGIVASIVFAGKDVRTPAVERTLKPTEYDLSASPFEKRFYVGDAILVDYNAEKYRLSIAAITDRLAVDTPSGRNLYMLGEEGVIDLDRDNAAEIQVYVGDFDKNDASKGALVRLTKTGKLAEASGSGQVAQATTDANATVQTLTTTTPEPSVPESPVNPASGVVLFPDNKGPYPFVLSVTFRNYCMFRYEADRRDRNERYYRKGDQLTVNANNGLKIWLSNGAAAKAIVQASGGKSVELDLGQPGEVAVKQLKWTQADNGTWSLGIYNAD